MVTEPRDVAGLFKLWAETADAGAATPGQLLVAAPARRSVPQELLLGGATAECSLLRANIARVGRVTARARRNAPRAPVRGVPLARQPTNGYGDIIKQA